MDHNFFMLLISVYCLPPQHTTHECFGRMFIRFAGWQKIKIKITSKRKTNIRTKQRPACGVHDGTFVRACGNGAQPTCTHCADWQLVPIVRNSVLCIVFLVLLFRLDSLRAGIVAAVPCLPHHSHSYISYMNWYADFGIVKNQSLLQWMNMHGCVAICVRQEQPPHEREFNDAEINISEHVSLSLSLCRIFRFWRKNRTASSVNNAEKKRNKFALAAGMPLSAKPAAPKERVPSSVKKPAVAASGWRARGAMIVSDDVTLLRVRACLRVFVFEQEKRWTHGRPRPLLFIS